MSNFFKKYFLFFLKEKENSKTPLSTQKVQDTSNKSNNFAKWFSKKKSQNLNKKEPMKNNNKSFLDKSLSDEQIMELWGNIAGIIMFYLLFLAVTGFSKPSFEESKFFLEANENILNQVYIEKDTTNKEMKICMKSTWWFGYDNYYLKGDSLETMYIGYSCFFNVWVTNKDKYKKDSEVFFDKCDSLDL